jgi:hypothetical protein
MVQDCGNFLIPNMTFVVELAAFIIVLGVLWRYVIPPVQQAMTARQEIARKLVSDRQEAMRLLEKRRLPTRRRWPAPAVRPRSCVPRPKSSGGRSCLSRRAVRSRAAVRAGETQCRLDLTVRSAPGVLPGIACSRTRSNSHPGRVMDSAIRPGAGPSLASPCGQCRNNLVPSRCAL